MVMVPRKRFLEALAYSAVVKPFAYL